MVNVPTASSDIWLSSLALDIYNPIWTSALWVSRGWLIFQFVWPVCLFQSKKTELYFVKYINKSLVYASALMLEKL